MYTQALLDGIKNGEKNIHRRDEVRRNSPCRVLTITRGNGRPNVEAERGLWWQWEERWKEGEEATAD